MGIVSAVPAGLHHFGVSLVNGRFLGELGLQLAQHRFNGFVEEPADEAQGKHILAFEHSLRRHAGVFERFLHQRGHGHAKHPFTVDAEFGNGVVGAVFGFLKVSVAESVGVADNDTVRFQKLEVGFEGCRVHGHQHVGFVARCVDAHPDMYLKTAHAAERSLRSANFSGIVGEGGYFISFTGRNVREDVTGKLHTVAGITTEAYYHAVNGFYLGSFKHNGCTFLSNLGCMYTRGAVCDSPTVLRAKFFTRQSYIKMLV